MKMINSDVMKILLQVQKESTCLKRQTACLIVKDNQIIAKSANYCNPPNEICQRMNIKTGKNYNLCNSKHAEELCAHQMKEKNLYDGEAYLLGHYYACGPCKKLLKERGVDIIHLVKIDE